MKYEEVVKELFKEAQENLYILDGKEKDRKRKKRILELYKKIMEDEEVRKREAVIRVFDYYWFYGSWKYAGSTGMVFWIATCKEFEDEGKYMGIAKLDEYLNRKYERELRELNIFLTGD